MTFEPKQPPWHRDLAGYRGAPPNPRWPGGARVAVSLVVNFEEGGEFAVSDGDPVNEDHGSRLEPVAADLQRRAAARGSGVGGQGRDDRRRLDDGCRVTMREIAASHVMHLR